MKSTIVDKLWFETLMEHKGLSLRSVARKMAIDAGALSRSLNSKRKLKPEEIKQLADILEQPAAKVLEHINVASVVATSTQPEGFGEMPQAQLSTSDQSTLSLKRHPLFGSMKGTSIVMPGVDLTQPADPDWAKVYDDDYDHGVIVEQQDTKRR